MKDRFITIKRNTESRDDYGGVTLTAATLKSIRAKVEDISGGESFEGMAQTAFGQKRFIIWYVDGSDILETDFIVYNSKNYHIRHIAEIERRKELAITAQWQQKTG